MLTATVGFLAIPSMILSNPNERGSTSASQVMIFTPPAQIVRSSSIRARVGLLLIRHNCTKPEKDLTGAVSSHN